MGQRLNIEIVNSDGVIANAYYHWSAYTNSAIELTITAITEYWEVESIDKELLKAVRMLEATGAGVNDEEREAITMDRRLMSGMNYAICNNRNNGLLSVTRKGIEDTERWEEGRVTINIDSKTVDFGVFWEYSEDEYNESMDDDSAYDSLERTDFDFSSVPFESIYELEEIYNEHPDGFIAADGYVVCWIE